MKKSDLEVALEHIDNLTKFFIDNSNFSKCSEEARLFAHSLRKQVMNTPEPDYNPDTKLPPGKYWIGDLCYIIQDQKRGELCGLIQDDDGRDNNRRVYTLKDGTRFMFCSTAYGDGVYYDQHYNRYGVDSGTIGMIALSDIDNHPDNNTALGHIHTFDEPTWCSYINGLIRFGNSSKLLTIDTDPRKDEDVDQY
jgi:hypothetical protein